MGAEGQAGPRPADTFAVIIATCGDESWRDMAMEHAVPSTWQQTLQPDEVVIGHESGMTVEESRNAGAEQARSRWLVFLDADDHLHPGYIQAMRDAAAVDTGGYDGWLFSPRMEDVDARTGRVLTKRRLPNRERPMTELNHCCIGTAVSRRLFQEVGGFRTGYSPWEDWELFLRCIRAGGEVVDVADAVYVARVRTGSRHRSITRQHAVELHARISREHREAL